MNRGRKAETSNHQTPSGVLVEIANALFQLELLDATESMANSAQDLIRALKASSDPPQSGGPHKIQIAREAWDNESLYVPNKAETVAEWLLTRLLKDKDREG